MDLFRSNGRESVNSKECDENKEEEALANMDYTQTNVTEVPTDLTEKSTSSLGATRLRLVPQITNSNLKTQENNVVMQNQPEPVDQSNHDKEKTADEKHQK